MSYIKIVFKNNAFFHNKFVSKKVIQESNSISRGKSKILKVGNIDLSRDFGYAPKYVEAMFLMLQKELPADYIICSGETISLREIIYYIFDRLNIPHHACQIDPKLYRPAEIENMFGDHAKAKLELGWKYDLSIFQTLDLLLEEELTPRKSL